MEFVSISRVINHMTCYQFECSYWWNIYLKKNPLQDLLSSLNLVISTNESTQFITGHVIYNLAYTYKFQLKTTKALLYFVLASISCFLIALTCFCGQWVATKLLWPIERDIYQLKRSQRNFADEHINDTRIVIDRYGNVGCLVSKRGIQN